MTQQPATKQTIWILWGAMFFSLFIYAGVSFFLKDTPVEGQNDPMMLTIIFSVMAFSMAVMGVLARPFYLKRLGTNKDRNTVMQTYTTGSIISWALINSVGVDGLVLYVLTKNETLFWAFLGSACLLHLIVAPSNRKIDQLLE